MEHTNALLLNNFEQPADQSLAHSMVLAFALNAQYIEDSHGMLVTELAALQMGNGKSPQKAAPDKADLNKIAGMHSRLGKALFKEPAP